MRSHDVNLMAAKLRKDKITLRMHNSFRWIFLSIAVIQQILGTTFNWNSYFSSLLIKRKG